MNLGDLNNLDMKAKNHLRNAEHAAGRAKMAATWRNDPGLLEAGVDLKIPEVPHWEGAPIRNKVQDSVRGHLPTILRAIELEEQATAKRETMAAELIFAQIRAAIVEVEP